VGKHYSSSIELITCTKASSTNLMYKKIFSIRIHDEERVFHNLASGFISKGFYIANFELFFMVMTNKDLCRSKTTVENTLKTHNSSSPNFLGWQNAYLKLAK
jgi:hypothetical protein